MAAIYNLSCGIPIDDLYINLMVALTTEQEKKRTFT
jgi:hypothetical protein